MWVQNVGMSFWNLQVCRTGLECYTGRIKWLQGLKQQCYVSIIRMKSSVAYLSVTKMADKNIYNLGTCQLLVEKKTLHGSAKCRVSTSLQRNAVLVNKYNLKIHAVFPAEKDVLVITSLEYCIKLRSLLSRADTAVLHMGTSIATALSRGSQACACAPIFTSGKSQAMHHTNRISSVWEIWRT